MTVVYASLLKPRQRKGSKLLQRLFDQALGICAYCGRLTLITRGREPLGAQALVIDDDHLPRLHVAQVTCHQRGYDHVKGFVGKPYGLDSAVKELDSHKGRCLAPGLGQHCS